MKKNSKTLHTKAFRYAAVAFSVLGILSLSLVTPTTDKVFAASFIQQYFQNNAKIITTSGKTNFFADFFRKHTTTQPKTNITNQATIVEKQPPVFGSAPNGENCDDLKIENKELRRKIAEFEVRKETGKTSDNDKSSQENFSNTDTTQSESFIGSDFAIEQESPEAQEEGGGIIFKTLGGDTLVEAGDDFVEIGQFSLENTLANEHDIEFKAEDVLWVKNRGSANLQNDIQSGNLALHDANGNQISHQTVIVGPTIAKFYLSNGVTPGHQIENGNTNQFYVRANLAQDAEPGNFFHFKAVINATNTTTNEKVQIMDENFNVLSDDDVNLKSYKINNDLPAEEDSEGQNGETEGPSQVTGVDTNSIGETSLVLTWDEATSDSGTIIGYKIHYGTSSVQDTGDSYDNVVEVEANPLSYAFTNLITNQTYYFAVTAIDEELNESQEFSEEVSVILEEIPFQALRVDIERTDEWISREISLEGGEGEGNIMEFSLRSWNPGLARVKNLRFEINDGFNSYSFIGAEIYNESDQLIGSTNEILPLQGTTSYLDITLNEELTYNNPEEFYLVLKLEENYLVSQSGILTTALSGITYEVYFANGPEEHSFTSDNVPFAGAPVLVVPSTPDQSISLSTGWNLVSSAINPESTDINNALAPLIFGARLEQAKDLTKSFIPGFPDHLNTLQTFEGAKGYWVKVNQDTVLNIAGEPVSLPHIQSLNANGWDLVGYPLNEESDAECLLEQLTESGNLAEAKDGDDNIIYPPTDTSPKGFLPGKAYWLRVNSPTTFKVSDECIVD